MSEWEIIETEDAMPIVNALKKKQKLHIKRHLKNVKILKIMMAYPHALDLVKH